MKFKYHGTAKLIKYQHFGAKSCGLDLSVEKTRMAGHLGRRRYS